MFKILDCTLRDGGYYTDWDFSSSVVQFYFQAMNNLPVDYLEIGYRNNPSKQYLGEFGYTPKLTIERIRQLSTKKLAVMLNEKSTRPADLDNLLAPLVGLIDMVRIAVDPKNFDRALELANAVKALGFEVAFNVMYMSKWSESCVISKFANLSGIVDILNMVDSFGGVTPSDVARTIAEIRQVSDVALGFHGHNNLQLGLINTITALEHGVVSVDATVLGMGRGAGNLNLELLLTYLNKHGDLALDFNTLGDAVMSFMPLLEQYRWGTNLPYMISGANSIPQRDVMAWVTNRVYSFNSIVRALDNRRNNEADNARFPALKLNQKCRGVVVIGGGESAEKHASAIRQYLAQNPEFAIVFATARRAKPYADLPNVHYYCLVGNEARRLVNTLGTNAQKGVCVLPPYPREMGTDVPSALSAITFELPKLDFTDTYVDSVTSVALQLALDLTDGPVYLVGYDGYPGNVLSEKEVTLMHENAAIFNAYKARTGNPPLSLTPSIYPELTVQSVYQFL